METEDLKYFELNNQVLKDFDKLMSMHLDYVEELKVSEIDTNSKLLNIISLCINIKKIIIEGDHRVNTNIIISNICKPEKLESLSLINVKLPNEHILKKLSGLKKIELKNIRFFNIVQFLKEIPCPEKVEEINLIDSDFGKNLISVLEKFEKIKVLKLQNVYNCKIEKLDFLETNKNLQKLIIKKVILPIESINPILKGKMFKNIDCELYSENDFKIKDYLKIEEDGKSLVTINYSNLDKLVNNVSLNKIDKLSLILDYMENIQEYIKPLKKVKGLGILIKDVSQLTQKDAKRLQEKLKIDTVDMLSIDEKSIDKSYSIKEYIEMRSAIEKFIISINNNMTETQKFLEIYKLLAKIILIDDEFNVTTTDLNCFKNEVIEKICLSKDFSRILQNCLACVGINSIIITGKIKSSKKEHTWNQVNLEGKWYNTDISLDQKYIKSNNILKRKVKYCLVGDRNFYETHIPNSENKKYAPEDFDEKILRVFFKTGVYGDKLVRAYFENLMSKIKVITHIGTQKVLTEGKIDSSEQ